MSDDIILTLREALHTLGFVLRRAKNGSDCDSANFVLVFVFDQDIIVPLNVFGTDTSCLLQPVAKGDILPIVQFRLLTHCRRS